MISKAYSLSTNIEDLLALIEKLNTKNPITIGVGDTFRDLSIAINSVERTLVRFNNNIQSNESKVIANLYELNKLQDENSVLKNDIEVLKSQVNELQDNYIRVLINVNNAFEKINE